MQKKEKVIDGFEKANIFVVENNGLMKIMIQINIDSLKTVTVVEKSVMSE